MTAFSSPVDIWNRSLDHCGGRAVTAYPPYDGSRNAAKCVELYDKLRQAELRKNVWVFSTRTTALRPVSTTTMYIAPAPYDPDANYFTGDMVYYEGTYFIAMGATTGNIPPVDVATGEVNLPWDNYTGPMTVDQWLPPSSTVPGTGTTIFVQQAYHSGELAYLAAGNGTVQIFMSLVDNNSDDPLQPDEWDISTTYQLNQIVEASDDRMYQSTVSLNIGNDPVTTTTATPYYLGVAYPAGALVLYQDDMIYQSLQGGNYSNPPYSSPTWWAPTGMWGNTWSAWLHPLPRSTSNKWHFLTHCSVVPLNLIFPVGCGPVEDGSTTNVFMLPYNFLAPAPDEQKIGASAYSWLGATTGSPPSDWIYTADFIKSSRGEPIIMRFISDFQNVSMMDALFCEALAARQGYALCEVLTQKPDLKAACRIEYGEAISQATLVNAIEIGPVLADEDSYIQVRY